MTPIAPGQVVEHPFIVDHRAMIAFAALSGDRSAVHVDPAFARARGYDDVIVYGGLMLAQLSYVVGTLMPGGDGVSVRWSIDFRGPLYVGELATLRLEVAHVSPGAGLVEGRFTIKAGERLVASGKTQSLAPTDRIAPDPAP
ncbi:MAG: (R)-hydratase [Caulobacter sp.]|nr:(R)-hydratase [Caulobacter sp.]